MLKVNLTEEEAFKVMEIVKAEFQFINEERVEFEKLPASRAKHLRALMVVQKIDGRPVNRILVDAGAALNLMLHKYFKKLDRWEEEMVLTNVTSSDFTSDISDAKGK